MEGAIAEGLSAFRVGTKVLGCLRLRRNDTMTRAPMPDWRRTTNC
jgi:hypothetical protein